MTSIEIQLDLLQYIHTAVYLIAEQRKGYDEWRTTRGTEALICPITVEGQKCK